MVAYDETFEILDDIDKPMGQLSRPAIVLVGKTGSGKSMFGNRFHSYLTGDNSPVFREGNSMYSETLIAKNQTVEIGGKYFDLVDTPGIFDTSGTDQQVLDEVTRTIQQCAYGVQAVILVIEYGRLTWEMRGVINAILNFFGADVKSNMILVVNKVDGEKALKRDLLRGELWREPPRKNETNPIQELLLTIDDRWILSTNTNAFPNPEDENWIREAKILVDQIISFQRPYTTNVFERIRKERELKEEEERQLKQKEIEHRQKIEKEWAELLEEAEKNRVDKEQLKTILDNQKRDREAMQRDFQNNLAKMQAEHKAQMEQRAREEAEKKVEELRKCIEELKAESTWMHEKLEKISRSVDGKTVYSS